MEACPLVLDDDLPDAFDQWVSELDVDEVIRHAQSWGRIIYSYGKDAGLKRAQEIIAS